MARLAFFATLGCLSSPLPAASGRVDPRSEVVFQAWSWLRADEIDLYAQYLDVFGVAEVLPMHQLLRTASDWDTPACRRIGAQPFDVPPAALWPSIVDTLRLLQHLQAAGILGAVEAVSVYRHPELNRCAGSSFPKHPQNAAVDLVPVDGASFDASIASLCSFHEHEGRAWRMGLGLYGHPHVARIHIDTHRYATWGGDLTQSSSPCTAR